jgi:hypothetical protein
VERNELSTLVGDLTKKGRFDLSSTRWANRPFFSFFLKIRKNRNMWRAHSPLWRGKVVVYIVAIYARCDMMKAIYFERAPARFCLYHYLSRRVEWKSFVESLSWFIDCDCG